jgi:hypothetical protein
MEITVLMAMHTPNKIKFYEEENSYWLTNTRNADFLQILHTARIIFIRRFGDRIWLNLHVEAHVKWIYSY